MQLPNCESALVEDIKLVGYLLSAENSKGKSVFFNRIGYEVRDYLILSDALKQLACTGEVIGTELTKFGMKYRVAGSLYNPYNRDVIVLSIWQSDTGISIPRLLTAYPY